MPCLLSDQRTTYRRVDPTDDDYDHPDERGHAGMVPVDGPLEQSSGDHLPLISSLTLIGPMDDTDTEVHGD